MTKTKIKKIIAATAIMILAAASIGTTLAATDIGDVNVTGNAAFNGEVMWDDNFPGTATGTVAGVVVKATIEPTLDMTISAEEIDLGVLVAGTPNSGFLDIEVGTNAVNGVQITVNSAKWGLENLSNTGVVLNSDTAGESYTFASATTDSDDSAQSGFDNTTGALTAVEIKSADKNTEKVIYESNGSEDTEDIDDVRFTVSATATADTPAGEYEDVLTFTVTGNF